MREMTQEEKLIYVQRLKEAREIVQTFHQLPQDKDLTPEIVAVFEKIASPLYYVRTDK